MTNVVASRPPNGLFACNDDARANVFRQWQGWSSAYQDLEARNKQLEADQNLNRNHANERLNRQWAVAYKQLELRNKILEEEKAQLKAWKNKNKIYVKKHPYL